MKTIKTLLAATGVALMTTACLGDKNYPDNTGIPNAVVTVKTNPADNVVFFQLDEKTTLLPVNITKHPFEGKEVRALINYKEVGRDPANYGQAPQDGYTKRVHVNWIKDILTKEMVPSVANNDEKYGKDPIGLRKGNCLIEDGYLTIVFAARYGASGKPHTINLVHGTDPNDPYTLELRHDAKGDTNATRVVEGWAAFKLNLPDTNGQTKKLKIRFNTDTGSQIIELDYTTGANTAPKAVLAKLTSSISSELGLE